MKLRQQFWTDVFRDASFDIVKNLGTHIRITRPDVAVVSNARNNGRYINGQDDFCRDNFLSRYTESNCSASDIAIDLISLNFRIKHYHAGDFYASV